MSQGIQRTLVPTLLFAAAVVAAAFAALPHLASAAANTVNVSAGGGEPGYAVNVFLPDDITIHTGDTVTWDFPWAEPHSITFGTPGGNPDTFGEPNQPTLVFDGETAFTSDLLVQTTFSVQFTKAGSYTIYCQIHPLMTATVTVVNSGDVSSQEDLDATADASYADALADLKTLAGQLSGQPLAVENKPDGTKQYTVNIGGVIANGSDVQQFFPPSLNVSEGDTVLFSNTTPTPHSASFRMDQYPGTNPFELESSPEDQPYDGSTYWGSALLGDGWPGGLEWKVTFSKAGTYDYLCILHVEQGMAGTVNVATAPEPEPEPTVIAPGPPATGTGMAASAPSQTLLLALLAALLVFAGTTSLVIGRRSR